MIKPYTRSVHYYETDQMGIIHHANYIHWFEEARVDLMGQIGFGYLRMEQEGIASPVLAVSCEYHSMVRFGDTVSVYPTIARLTPSQMTVRYRVEDAISKELRATGETRHCFLNADGRPVPLKKHCPQAYELFAKLLVKQ